MIKKILYVFGIFISISVSSIYGLSPDIPMLIGTLATVNATRKADVSNLKLHTFQVDVSNVDTNVILRFEGSLDGTNFYNFNDAEVDTTYVADGTYLAHKEDKAKYVRVSMISKSPINSTPSVTVKYIGGI